MEEWLHLVTKDTVIVIDAMRLIVSLSDPPRCFSPGYSGISRVDGAPAVP
jgi:hypothetical protein